MATLTDRSLAYIESMNYLNKDDRWTLLNDRNNDEFVKRIIKVMGVDLTKADVEKIFNALVARDAELLM